MFAGSPAVFPAEEAAGLADLVRASARVAYAARAVADVGPPEFLLPPAAAAAGRGQPDLFYLKSVLVSTGINKNDDFFEHEETWRARSSPEDKPFNYEHRPTDIIGHMTGVAAVDFDLNPVPLDGPAPPAFSLVTTAVLYRVSDDPEFQKRMDRVVADVRAGKYCVSMEALFSGFDYLLVPAANDPLDTAGARVVERTEGTAFLTKHLRAYGGSGRYGDQRVGRVLRDITFSAVGLVKNPANPRSVILGYGDRPLSGAAAKILHPGALPGYGTNSHTPDRTGMNEVEALQAKVAQLTEKLERAEAKLADADKATWERHLSEAKAALAEMTSKYETEAARRAEAEAAKAKAASLETELVAARQALADLEAARKLALRVAAVKAAYEFDADADAEAQAKTLAGLPDDAFDAHLKAMADYMAKKKAAYQAAVPQPQPQTIDQPTPIEGGSAQPTKPPVVLTAGPAKPPVKNEPNVRTAVGSIPGPTDPPLATTPDADPAAEFKALAAEMLAYFQPESAAPTTK